MEIMFIHILFLSFTIIGYLSAQFPSALNSNELQGFAVYPTLVRDVLYIRNDYSNNCRVELYNITGTLVKSYRLSQNPLDLTGFISGFYIVRVIFDDNTSRNVKIIKE